MVPFPNFSCYRSSDRGDCVSGADPGSSKVPIMKARLSPRRWSSTDDLDHVNARGDIREIWLLFLQLLGQAGKKSRKL